MKDRRTPHRPSESAPAYPAARSALDIHAARRAPLAEVVRVAAGAKPTTFPRNERGGLRWNGQTKYSRRANRPPNRACGLVESGEDSTHRHGRTARFFLVNQSSRSEIAMAYSPRHTGLRFSRKART